jgi:hypothetical protein
VVLLAWARPGRKGRIGLNRAMIAKTRKITKRTKKMSENLEKEKADQVLAAAHQCSQRDYLMLRVL